MMGRDICMITDIEKKDAQKNNNKKKHARQAKKQSIQMTNKKPERKGN